MQQYLLILTLLACVHSLSAQDRYSPWGEVPEADMKMAFYPADSAAGAVVLQDVGNIHLTENNRGDWVVKYEFWRRIKIFNTAAFNEGNLFIPFSADKRIEKMTDLDVQIIFPNGSVKKIKSDNIYSEQVSEHWKVKKIFIPGLQKGCIIEYRYELTKSYIESLYDWYFQDDLPVRWSEVSIVLPDFFNYAILLQHINSFAVDEQDKELKEKLMYGGKYKSKISRFGMANLPALKEEPFITTVDDYRASIRFQKDYTGAMGDKKEAEHAWKMLAVNMSIITEFGAQYLYDPYSDQLWAEFSQQITGDSADVIIEKARSFVSGNIKWNKEFSMYVSQPIDIAYKTKQGNSAEVNMAVVALLRRAGIESWPVLVSTRNNGSVQTLYPFTRQFNSLVAGARRNGQIILIDAIDPFLPVGRLHATHYNYHGWMVDPDMPEWVDINPPEVAMVWLAKVKLSEDGVIKGIMDVQANNDIATTFRDEIKATAEEQEQFVREKILNGYKDCDIDSLVFIDKEDINKPLRIKMNFSLNDGANVINDYIYLKPILDFLIVDNPFKSDKRTYPVSFPYPMKANYIINLEIPDHYSLEELPKQERIALPNDLGSIAFSCTKEQHNAKMIQITLRMQLKSIDFGPEYYDVLRTFFNLVAEKTAMQLVLKKEQ